MNTRFVAGAGALLIGAWIASRAFRAARYTLRDKVVLISGGSRGLGLVLARHICEQHGKVVLIARDREDLARAMQLHFWAPYELVSQVVPEMRLWGGGRIVNI